MAMLAVATGTSIATENVFESRFVYVDELRRMGADIRTEGHHAVIGGWNGSPGAGARRGHPGRRGDGVAALCAEGETGFSDIHHLDRGYEEMESQLAAFGADVRREGDAVLVPDPRRPGDSEPPPGAGRPAPPRPDLLMVGRCPLRMQRARTVHIPAVTWGPGLPHLARGEPRCRAGRRRHRVRRRRRRRGRRGRGDGEHRRDPRRRRRVRRVRSPAGCRSGTKDGSPPCTPSGAGGWSR